MTVQPRDCAKCGGAMTVGFVADHAHGALAVSSWVEGAPRKSVWVGVQLGGKARSEIATWRCRRCGFLESYAMEEPNLNDEVKTRAQVRVLLIVLGLIAALTAGVSALLLVN